jgi:uncharacterized protein (DUF302 family)
MMRPTAARDRRGTLTGEIYMSQVLRLFAAALVVLTFALSSTFFAQAGSTGVVRVKSAYPLEETVTRIKADIAAKGIMLFDDIDQAKLAADAGIALAPSRLLLFGNPPLGTQFLTSNPVSGLDWPVRLLVHQDAKGRVWVAYNDFGYIARRHGIKNRGKQFKMASEVVASITSTVRAQ